MAWLYRRVYLIDEPERHLQSRLQRAVASWLQDTLAGLGAQAVISTHASAILNGFPDLHIVRVDRKTHADAFELVHPQALIAADGLVAELGFDRGELLAGIAVVLYVGGAGDRIVLQTLFGQRLREARIAVSAFGGTRNLIRGAEDPLVAFNTARIAVLLANVEARRLRPLQNDAS